jgi:hypothetical protein
MKRILLTATLVAAIAPAFAADVGVSVTVGEPGFYGQINIGDFPRPQLVYSQPMVIQPAPVGVVYQPMYLHVPPGHAKKWSKHCYKYNACGRPVYFVQDNWYNNVYVPQYREHDGHGKHEYRGDDRRDDQGDRGEGHGNGKGHDKHDKGHGKGRGHD